MIFLVTDESVEIVRLSESRWNEFRQFRIESLKIEPEAFGSSAEEEESYEPEIWKERIHNVIFATQTDRIVGMLSCVIRNRVKTRHIADIFGVFVLPAFRRRGIANRLLSEAISYIEEHPEVTKIQLTVNSDQLPAVGLYSKNGFMPVGQLKAELKIGNMFYDETIMEKHISRA